MGELIAGGHAMTNREAIGQLTWLKKRISDIIYSPESFEALNLAIKTLEERQQGEWLKNCENCDCNHCYESGYRFTRKDCQGTCSVCGVLSYYTGNFCPNCGAKMEVEEE